MGAPLALRDLGMKEADLDRAAEIATQNPYWNPRPVTRDGVAQTLAGRLGGRGALGLKQTTIGRTTWQTSRPRF